ncbi:histidinol-phosphate transaminase [Clostridioides difficile CD109]|nr:histidinol-phosphate transaminase [Clostridioides difficile CD38]EQE39627.1 histidinol-phosphate transaminase [Clostridioides difficile CD40]EQE96027.1 histidinol-phosphate transaminase [Clostridioides difficile CD109]EQH05368.1 histidinol-phosphate transaminase [Clostridioides difficile DA00195]EQH35740.1 histidinol-phosphate transaminase [Clostridioides difficile DA00232]EQH67776.1 histidinol-phosphate transaminase [Clostridioides difficile DA00256]EQH99770.1 histidinol-phosphate transam
MKIHIQRGLLKMIEKLLRNTVKELHQYVPGEPIEKVKEKYGVKEIIKLASNENPLGPSPKAIEAMIEMLKQGQLYPEPEANELRRKLAEKLDLKPENFIVANGADNVITLIGEAFINRGDEVIYCNPTFPSYRTATIKNEGIPVEVPLTEDYKYDLQGILDKITDKTKLICVCNPNNPTGTIVDDKELEEFLKKVPENIITILDEAYIEFLTVPNYVDGLKYVRENYNVIVTRTFSKIYGLAGLRVGYGIAKDEIIRTLFTVKEPFSANRVAISGATAALDDEEFIKETYELNRVGMAYFKEEFTKMGFDVVDSQSNFLYVDMKTDIPKLFEDLKKRGFVIRPSATHARVSIGTMEENKKFVAVLKEILNIKGEPSIG